MTLDELFNKPAGDKAFYLRAELEPKINRLLEGESPVNQEPMYQDIPVPYNKVPLEQQDKAIADLHAAIGDLTNRLKFVMTPDTVAKEAEDTSPDSSSVSPLAQHILANTEELYKAGIRLRRLMDRLEI